MSYNGTGVFTAGKCLNELMNLTDLKGRMFSAAKKEVSWDILKRLIRL